MQRLTVPAEETSLFEVGERNRDTRASCNKQQYNHQRFTLGKILGG